MTNSIFVFGSNTAGRHGAGSALEAVKNHGARIGIGFGLQGNSYAIPTKDHRLKTLQIADIAKHVNDFVYFAAMHGHLTFTVVEIGCGLAGYKPSQIAPLFANCKHLINVYLSDNFVEELGWFRK